MPRKVLINSRTSGKFKRELIDGRSHIVTTMMPIRGDITMNNKFYPDDQVKESYEQLNMLPAPHGHPMVNGINVPAFHPVANNKHNIGGWLRNSRKKGKRVFVDFMLDEEIANNSESGKETIRRIEEGEKIGVSTGLTISQITNKQGEDDFGKPFNMEVGGFNFDHVAILLNEAAAGEHAGTELILNENEEEIELAIFNELSFEDIHQAIIDLIRPSYSADAWVHVRDIMPESKTFVFTVDELKSSRKTFKQSFAIDQQGNLELLGDRVAGTISEMFEPEQQLNNNREEVDDMDKNQIVLAIIGNSANKFTVADNARLMAMSDDELTSIIATNIDAEGAKEILINAGHDFAGYDNFVANKEKFTAFLEAENTRLQVMRDNIVANSEYTPEMVANHTEVELTAINALIKPEKEAKRIPQQDPSNTIQTNSSVDSEIQFNYS